MISIPKTPPGDGRSQDSDAPLLRLERLYPHSPDRVWRALTDPRALSRWLLPGDFRPRLGHRFLLRGRREGTVRGEVIALEEGRRLVYTWRRDGEEIPSVISWTLEPADGGRATRVRLEQTGPQASARAWLPAPGLLVLFRSRRGRMGRPIPGTVAVQKETRVK